MTEIPEQLAYIISPPPKCKLHYFAMGGVWSQDGGFSSLYSVYMALHHQATSVVSSSFLAPAPWRFSVLNPRGIREIWGSGAVAQSEQPH